MQYTEIVIPPKRFHPQLRKIAILIRIVLVLNFIYGFVLYTNVKQMLGQVKLFNFKFEIIILLFSIFSSLAIYLISHKILRQKNWAKIVCLVYIFFQFLSIPNIVGSFKRSPTLGVIQCVQVIIGIYIGYLFLFNKDVKKLFPKRK